MGASFQQKQVSVGILLGVREENIPGVLLQVRAPHDSYAGACQVTTHGKLTDQELKLDESASLATALGRKLRDEIGPAAAEMVEASLSSAVDLERVVNAKGRLVVTRGLDLECDAASFMTLIVPGKDVGGFRVCTDPSTLLPLDDSYKAAGVPAEEARMFPDEMAAVRSFFEKVLLPVARKNLDERSK